jgi:hypothetical protein
MRGGGELLNYGYISGAGTAGANIESGTVFNAGTISGGTLSNSVDFRGDYNRLILAETSHLMGAVICYAGTHNVLELAGTAAKTSGQIGGLGTKFQGFETLQVDDAAHWRLAGGNTASGLVIDLGQAAQLTLLGTLANTGTLTVGETVTGAGGALVVSGQLTTTSVLAMLGQDTLRVGKTGLVQVGAGTTAVAGEINVMSTGTLIGSGTLAGSVVDAGKVISDGGQLTITGAVTGTGQMRLDSHSTLVVNGKLHAAAVNFTAGGHETLKLGAPATCTATISGFAGGDVIDMEGMAITGESFSGGVLTLTGAGGTLARLKFAGTYTTGNFTLGDDGHGGVKIGFKAAAEVTPSTAGFSSAMAGLGVGADASSPALTAEPWARPPAMLAAAHPVLS